MKRRKFLGLSFCTTTITILSASGCSLFSPSRSSQDLSFYGLDQKQTGQIDDEVLEILEATVLTITLLKTVEIGHYQDFFRWRAENIPGYKAIYEGFSKSIKDEVKRIGRSKFNELELGERINIINQYRPAKKMDFIHALRSTFDSDLKEKQEIYESFLFSDILKVFQRTDALKLVGYNHWFGVPRGLDDYRKKVSQSL